MENLEDFDELKLAAALQLKALHPVRINIDSIGIKNDSVGINHDSVGINNDSVGLNNDSVGMNNGGEPGRL